MGNKQTEISQVIKQLHEQMVDNDPNNEINGYLTDVERSVKDEIREQQNEEYKKIMLWLEELKQYRELKELGFLKVLPVVLGQTLYTNQRKLGWYFKLKDAPYRVKVVFIALNNADNMGGGYFNVMYEKHDHMMAFNFNDIGESIFPTRSEAEEKIERIGGEK